MRAAILFGLPLAVMLVSIIIGTGTAYANGQNVAFSGNQQQSQTLTSISCNSLTTACFPSASTLPQNSIISCQSIQALTGQTVNSCLLLNGVCYLAQNGGTYQNSIFCAAGNGIFAPYNTYLTSGSSITVSQTGAIQNNNSNVLFNFGGIGPSGFIVMIIAVIAVAVLTGITVLGSGLSPEAIHIVLMGGFFVGIWAIVSAADGFLTGSQTSLFTQANISLAGSGSIMYVFLSLLWSMGTITTISRGGGA